MRNGYTIRYEANDGGWCLSELVMAMAVGICVLAGSFAALNSVHAQALHQQRVMAGYQEMRMGLEVFEQEVRMASASSITVAQGDRLEFTANLSSLETSTTASVEPGAMAVPVQNGSGWGRGKTVRLCGAMGCETHRLAQDGRRAQLVLAEPVTSRFPAGASVEVMNRVAYYTKMEIDGTRQFMRMVDGGAGVLIGAMQDVEMSYWDEQGQLAVNLNRIVRAVIAVELDEPTGRIIRDVSVRS